MTDVLCNECAARPVERVRSPAGEVELCLGHVLWWYPGRDAAWWEERHAPFQDHTRRYVLRNERGEQLRLL